MTPAPKQLIRGVDHFRQFIEQGGYFIDKTLFIQEVLDNPHQVIVLPRPRRFGKSLNMSMLRFFFDCTEANTAALFQPYQIWQTGAKYTQQQGKYPVLELTLKNVQKTNWKDTTLALKQLVTQLYQQHDYLLDSTFLKNYEKKKIEQILTEEASLIQCESSLLNLCRYLYRHHQQEVVVLIDEYDSPIIAGYQYHYYEKIVNFMQGFLGSVFKTNPYLYKGVVTGILRIAKESLFSKWNNPGVYTLLNHAFADKFGFTEAETKQMLAHFNLQTDFAQIKQWYDGYKMGTTQHVYNPWSITGYISAYEEGFKPYWVNTSADQLLKERVTEKDALATRNTIAKLLNGETIQKTIYQNIVFSDFNHTRELFWTLLVFTGYLTPVSHITKGIYNVKIPNYEIASLFERFILEWLQTGLQIPTTDLLKMVQALTANRISEFERYFKRIMGDTMSYFDINKEAEKVWQAYILGLLAISSEQYILKSNRESGAGRYDILMLPRWDKTKYGVIIEIKSMAKGSTQKQIERQLDKALAQMTNNRYYQELIDQQIEQRIELAIVFVGKELYLKPKK